jgi:hypothetical protein
MTGVMRARERVDMIERMGEPNTQPLVPRSAVPLAYFACAHVGLAGALAVLVVEPGLPGGFFYHPRMIALVHVLTLAWLSGSILGAFYIVGPLALRIAMPAGRADWVGVVVFATGTAGMVSHFWLGEYNGMAWSAGMVSGTLAWVGWRAGAGLARAPVPAGVKLHVALAFVNIMAAAMFGIVIGLDRGRGFLNVSPLASTYAHAHLAAVGWVAMMVTGLAYRLIPMILPAAMPTGRSLALSAVLIECGLIVLVLALISGSAWLPLGSGLIAAGFASFVMCVRRTVRRRLPRPPALPRRDWSTWQTHAAFLWLLIAMALGIALSVGVPDEWRVPVAWTYGVAGLVGFLAQVVVGIQGRLVPMYVWYRALAARGGAPPPRGANDLPSPAFARPIFGFWTAGVPLLAWGLATEHHASIRVAAALLLAGTSLGAAYLVHMLRAVVRAPAARAAATSSTRHAGGQGGDDVSSNPIDRAGRGARARVTHHADRAGDREPRAGANEWR